MPPQPVARVLLYELNEVPWRVVDDFVAAHPDSAFAAVRARAAAWTTRSVDDGELHPWSTWPTLHRGVSVQTHGLRLLNQDRSCAARYPPLWSLLRAGGRSVGIFGSLQSHPPLRGEGVSFHVPDTFAPDAAAEPASMSVFQRFNLRQARANKALAGRLSIEAALDAAKVVAARQMSPRTLRRVLTHLLRERLDPSWRGLRPILQGDIAFDAFRHLLRTRRPDYVSFFTNHVASVMHRYWRVAYPGDFDGPGPVSSSSSRTPAPTPHRRAIDLAMQVVDRHLAGLLLFCREHGYDLVIASSMGQAAIDRGAYAGELRVDDTYALCAALGIERPAEVRPAMQPDTTLVFASADAARRCIAQFERMRDPEGGPVLWTAQPPLDGVVGLKVHRSPVSVARGHVLVDGLSVPLARAGLSAVWRDPGTGYHVPEGVLLWLPAGTASEGSENTAGTAGRATTATDHAAAVHGSPGRHPSAPMADSRQVMPTILARLGVAAPRYAMPPLDPLRVRPGSGQQALAADPGATAGMPLRTGGAAAPANRTGTGVGRQRYGRER